MENNTTLTNIKVEDYLKFVPKMAQKYAVKDFSEKKTAKKKSAVTGVSLDVVKILQEPSVYMFLQDYKFVEQIKAFTNSDEQVAFNFAPSLICKGEFGTGETNSAEDSDIKKEARGTGNTVGTSGSLELKKLVSMINLVPEYGITIEQAADDLGTILFNTNNIEDKIDSSTDSKSAVVSNEAKGIDTNTNDTTTTSLNNDNTSLEQAEKRPVIKCSVPKLDTVNLYKVAFHGSSITSYNTYALFLLDFFNKHVGIPLVKYFAKDNLTIDSVLEKSNNVLPFLPTDLLFLTKKPFCDKPVDYWQDCETNLLQLQLDYVAQYLPNTQSDALATDKNIASKNKTKQDINPFSSLSYVADFSDQKPSKKNTEHSSSSVYLLSGVILAERLMRRSRFALLDSGIDLDLPKSLINEAKTIEFEGVVFLFCSKLVKLGLSFKTAVRLLSHYLPESEQTNFTRCYIRNFKDYFRDTYNFGKKNLTQAELFAENPFLFRLVTLMFFVYSDLERVDLYSETLASSSENKVRQTLINDEDSHDFKTNFFVYSLKGLPVELANDSGNVMKEYVKSLLEAEDTNTLAGVFEEIQNNSTTDNAPCILKIKRVDPLVILLVFGILERVLEQSKDALPSKYQFDIVKNEHYLTLLTEFIIRGEVGLAV